MIVLHTAFIACLSCSIAIASIKLVNSDISYLVCYLVWTPAKIEMNQHVKTWIILVPITYFLVYNRTQSSFHASMSLLNASEKKIAIITDRFCCLVHLKKRLIYQVLL